MVTFSFKKGLDTLRPIKDCCSAPWPMGFRKVPSCPTHYLTSTALGWNATNVWMTLNSISYLQLIPRKL